MLDKALDKLNNPLISGGLRMVGIDPSKISGIAKQVKGLAPSAQNIQADGPSVQATGGKAKTLQDRLARLK